MCEEDLLKLIDQLPVKYKEVFNMAVIDNYSHREISEELKIKESTSRSILKRAKEKIIKRIETQQIKEKV